MAVARQIIGRFVRVQAWALALVGASVLAPRILAQAHDRVSDASFSASTSPLSLARDAIANEVRLIQYDGAYLRYRVHTKDSKGDQVRDVLESKDGTVARLVLRNGRPLSSDEDAGEHQRLQEMLDSPSAFQKHIQKDRSGKKTAVDLIKLLPDAMLFGFVNGQPQREGWSASRAAEYVIDFKPNPQWTPPTMVSQVLTGIGGRCWIDPATHHLTRLELNVIQPVNFGFGVFARIYPGGTVAMEQQPVGETRWVVDRFTEHVTVRALMVRTMNEDTDLFASSFTLVPPMSYQEAIHLLLTTPAPGSGQSTQAGTTSR